MPFTTFSSNNVVGVSLNAKGDSLVFTELGLGLGLDTVTLSANGFDKYKGLAISFQCLCRPF